MNNRLVAIILNYNSANDTNKCIEFLKLQDYRNLDILIVDNNSSEDNVEKVKEIAKKHNVNLICNKKNNGYSAGNNIGLKYALETQSDWSLIINPDVEIRDKQYITKMMFELENKVDVAVAGSNVILPDGQVQNPMIEPSYYAELFWMFENIKRKILRKNSYIGKPKTGYCEKINGCCFFINMNFIRKHGLLDDKVFLYCEESILAKKVKKCNYKEYYFNEISAYHMHVFTKSDRKRIKEYRKSRIYYWENYCDYNAIKLKLLLLSNKLYELLIN